jgi:hypothetical protein
MTSQSTSACRFIGGPYDNRIIAIPDHTQTIETTTLDVDPDLRWIPELGGWLIADPDTGPASPNIAPRTIRYQRQPDGTFAVDSAPRPHAQPDLSQTSRTKGDASDLG